MTGFATILVLLTIGQLVRSGNASCPPQCLCDSYIICRGIDLSTLSFDYNNFEFLDLKRNFISSQLQITGHWPPHVFTDLRLIDFRGPTSGNEILCLSIPELAASFPKVTILSDCQSNYTTESPSTGTSISSSPVPRSSARPPTTAPPPAPPGASTLVDKILEPVIGLISAFFVAMVLLVIGVVWGLVKKLTDTVRYRVLHEINDDRQPLIVGVSPRGKARRVARRIKKGLKIKNRGKKSKIELSSTDSEVENETEVSDHREKDGDMVEKKNRADALAALEAAGMGISQTGLGKRTPKKKSCFICPTSSESDSYTIYERK